jgi:pimeloyl-ACP methyl ester carboxylesterase
VARVPTDDHRLELDAGRYSTWGDSQGTPVFIAHGTPGSRRALSPGLDDSVWLRQQRLRFIGVDRPGYGNPDPWPEASLPRFCPSPPPFLARFWQSVPSEDPADSSLLSDSSIADL